MNREEILKHLRDSPVSDLTDRVETMLKPSIRLLTRAVGADALALGASRIGGLPDVPAEFEWPCVERLPLAFIAQVQLNDVSGFEPQDVLPSSGWLLFFYEAKEEPWGFDPAHCSKWKVLYFDQEVGKLERASRPALPEESDFRLCAVEFEAELTVPCPGVLSADGVVPAFSKQWDQYYDLYQETWDAEDKLRHRLLGHADVIQADSRESCQMASNGVYCGDGDWEEHERYAELAPGASDWILLLQIDTDEDGPCFMWGDCGRLYYWIRKQDLANRDFARVWLDLQCS